MGKIKRGALALVVGAVLAAGPLAGGASAVTGTPGKGCPYGAFCIYPGAATQQAASFSAGPEKNGIFYAYGAHNLTGQYRYHAVYNNQYKVNGVVAGVTFCTGYNGKGQTDGYLVSPKAYSVVYMTPVNSITLWLYTASYTSLLECGNV